MASNQTSNYGLNQWEPGDKVIREEFNADNTKIDAAFMAVRQEAASALAAVRATVNSQAPTVYRGSYTGTGSTGRVRYATGFRPRLVAVWLEDPESSNNHQLGFMGMEGMCAYFAPNGYCGMLLGLVAFDSGGFTIDHSLLPVNSAFNRTSVRYNYWAMN